MSDLAAHLFVLGIALLAVPITAALGPTVTWFVGAFCVVAAVGVSRSDTDGAPASATQGHSGESVNCGACGARVPAREETCEHCGASL